MASIFNPMIITCQILQIKVVWKAKEMKIDLSKAKRKGEEEGRKEGKEGRKYFSAKWLEQ
jgi:hypothetical protein